MAEFKINNRNIGNVFPTYIIAEMSANHNQNLDHALAIVDAAKEAGADAVKLQTYTADTITLDSNLPYFQIDSNSQWGGQTLHALYKEAYTPWEWHEIIQKRAHSIGLDFFSTPFDPTAVDFLEKLKVPVHKVASFEIVDIPLIEKIARTKKPIIMSTGMATYEEIKEAVDAVKAQGNDQLALLKCTSAYPAPPEEMNLITIPDLAQKFGVISGLSDHTLGIQAPIAAVALGARIIEKHFTLSRADKGPDSMFSLEPAEFKAMVQAVRVCEQSLGVVHYSFSPKEAINRQFRRSLFVYADISAGEKFTENTVRSIRPAHGLHPRHLKEILGKVALTDIKRGTPLTWEHIKK